MGAAARRGRDGVARKVLVGRPICLRGSAVPAVEPPDACPSACVRVAARRLGDRGGLGGMALLLTAALLGSIYPEGHFDTVTKLTKANIDATIKEQVDAGKTLFVRFIASEG